MKKRMYSKKDRQKDDFTAYALLVQRPFQVLCKRLKLI